MSISNQIVEIQCDGRSKNEPCPDSAARLGTNGPYKLRRDMKDEGWYVNLRGVDIKDQCPECGKAT